MAPVLSSIHQGDGYRRVTYCLAPRAQRCTLSWLLGAHQMVRECEPWALLCPRSVPHSSGSEASACIWDKSLLRSVGSVLQQQRVLASLFPSVNLGASSCIPRVTELFLDLGVMCILSYWVENIYSPTSLCFSHSLF